MKGGVVEMGEGSRVVGGMLFHSNAIRLTNKGVCEGKVKNLCGHGPVSIKAAARAMGAKSVGREMPKPALSRGRRSWRRSVGKAFLI